MMTLNKNCEIIWIYRAGLKIIFENIYMYFFLPCQGSKEISGEVTHHVDQVLELFLGDKVVIDPILFSAVGPPGGVADSE